MLTTDYLLLVWTAIDATYGWRFGCGPMREG
jgi:hypothetical protein